MGSRLNVVFHEGRKTDPMAVIYGHWAGDDPASAATTLATFFDELEAETTDRRYDDASYLSAKYVVFLALPDNSVKTLDFLGVGVVPSVNSMGPSCVAYVDCSKLNPYSKRPHVEVEKDHKGEADQILGQIPKGEV